MIKVLTSLVSVSVVAAATTAVLASPTAAPASAGAARVPATAVSGPGAAQTFGYTGTEQVYSVPAGVSGVHVVAVGAAGTSVGDDLGVQEQGGYGAMLTADVPLPSGTATLYVEVGGVGATASAFPWASGGFNGGGGGPLGGGGASDIRTVSCGSACANGQQTASSLGSRLAVAGGGGAAGGSAAGGNAGGNNGDGLGGSTPVSGSGATPSTGGAIAIQSDATAYCTDLRDEGAEVGGAGGLGVGGAGATFFSSAAFDGGGGGGLYGGGGGGECYNSGLVPVNANAGAGGGGSSGAPDGINVSISTDSTDPPEVTISAPVPTPLVAPTLTGGATVGDQLTESHGGWTTSLPLTGYQYQWERCSSAGVTCNPISGADQQTYTVSGADLGSTLRVEEIATNFYGTSQPAVSAATPVVFVAAAPSVSISGPSNAVVGKPTTFTAAVSDSQGTPTGYRWSAGGTVLGTAPTVTVRFAQAGATKITVQVTDSAGNSFTGQKTLTVSPPPPLGRINATMTWAFRRAGTDLTVMALSVVHAPVGADIVVVCTGGGCPSGRRIAVTAARCAEQSGKRCRPPSTRTVSLTPVFAHHHLASQARLTVRIVRPQYVGKVYVFSMTAPNAPTVACLAPGGTIPGKGC